jgi:hypothetical protein
MTRPAYNLTSGRALVFLALLAQLGCSPPSTSPIKQTAERPTQPPGVVQLPSAVKLPNGEALVQGCQPDSTSGLPSYVILRPADERTRSIAAPQSRAESEDAIRELVVRRLVQQRAAVAPLFFLAVDEDIDPTETFRARFADLPTKLRKASRAVKEDGIVRGRSRYSDRLTHERGPRVSVGKLLWIAPDRVEVDGEIDANSMGYERLTLLIRKVNSRWVIVSTPRRVVR